MAEVEKDALNLPGPPRGIRDRDVATSKAGGNDLVCIGIAAVGWAVGLVASYKAKKAQGRAQRSAAEAQDARAELAAGVAERLRLKEYAKKLDAKLDAAKKEQEELSGRAEKELSLEAEQKARQATADVARIEETTLFINNLNRLADKYLNTPAGSVASSALTERIQRNERVDTPVQGGAVQILQHLLNAQNDSPRTHGSDRSMIKTATHVAKQIDEARGQGYARKTPTPKKAFSAISVSPRSTDENAI